MHTALYKKLVCGIFFITTLFFSLPHPVRAENCCNPNTNKCLDFQLDTCTSLGYRTCTIVNASCTQAPAGGQTSGICNPVLAWLCETNGGPTQAIGNIISALLGLILIFGGLYMFANLVIGAIQWIGSGGDKGALESARNRIVHAIIGLILLACTWAIMILVLDRFLGMSFPNITLPRIDSTSPLPRGGQPIPTNTPGPNPPTSTPTPINPAPTSTPTPGGGSLVPKTDGMCYASKKPSGYACYSWSFTSNGQCGDVWCQGGVIGCKKVAEVNGHLECVVEGGSKCYICGAANGNWMAVGGDCNPSPPGCTNYFGN